MKVRVLEQRQQMKEKMSCRAGGGREGHACRRGTIANVAQIYSEAHSRGQRRILEGDNCWKQGTHKGIVDCHVMNRNVSHVEVKESMQTSCFRQFVMSHYMV